MNKELFLNILNTILEELEDMANTIRELKAELKEAKESRDNYRRWWKEEEQKRQALEKKLEDITVEKIQEAM